MFMAFIAKTICDLSLWFASAGLILSIFGSFGASVWPAAIMAAVSAVCRALDGKKQWIRLLPLIALGGCAFFIQSVLDALLIVPPMVYVVLIHVGARYSLQYESSKKYYRITAMVLLAVTFLAAVSGGAEIVEKRMLIYLTAFLLCGVLMLRQLRSDEHMQREWRLRLIDTGLLAGCLAAVFFFSSNWFVGAAGGVLGAFNNAVIKPTADFINGLLGGAGRIASDTLEPPGGEVPQGAAPIDADSILGDMQQAAANEAGQESVLDLILIIVGVLLFLTAAFLLFRKLRAQREKQESTESGVVEYRRKIPTEAKSKQIKTRRLQPRSPGERVRFYYRKLLQSAAKKGITIHESFSSAQVAAALSNTFDSALVSEFRRIYISARYSSAEIPPAHSRRAKQLLAQMKKSHTAPKRK